MIIDQLQNLASVQETDEIPVERGTTTYKSTLQKMKDLVASLLTKSDVGLANVDNVKQYSFSNPPPYPVTSVNGQTGAVTVQAATDAQVTNAVDTWLDNNVDPATGYVLDSTLTMSNAAPPASAVGVLKSALNTKAPIIINTASGAVASFTDGADNMPIKALTVNVEPIQAGSGDPSPDNVRPISGRTSATIYHSGADTSDPTTYTIQLDDTVYGGTLDVTGGKMVVDRAMVDLGTLTWGYRTGSGLADYFYCNFNGIKFSGAFSDTAYPILTSIYKATPRSSAFLNNCICVDGAAAMEMPKQIQIKDSRYTDTATFKTAMSGVQLCYELAQPIEITLTPTQIDTLLGTNNIWSDAGDVDVDYRADTKLYIDNIHQPTDNDMTADAQIASGKFFLIGGTLYKSTTVIPAGDTIIPGTNCVRTNLAEALNALNA